MEALIVYPENKEQLIAVKAIMKAMKISFESQSENLPEHVKLGVKEALKEIENGQSKPYAGMKDLLDLA